MLAPRVFCVPLVRTRNGWDRFVGPVVLIGDEPVLADEKLGEGVKVVIGMHRSGVPDHKLAKDGLDRAVRQHGFRSQNIFLRDCLQMSVEETTDGYQLTPYERYGRSGQGAVPLVGDLMATAGRESGELGRTVRHCFSYCR